MEGLYLKPHACLSLSTEELALFHKIDKILQEMPEIDLEKNKKGEKVILSCHMITRALAKFLPVEYKDGYFGNFNQHSWLVTKERLIIDPYPVAVVGGPILIDTRFITGWSSLYQEASFSKLTNSLFQKSVEKVTEVVCQTMDRLKIKETANL